MHHRLAFDPMVRRVAWLVPPRVLHRCARWALADRQVALCLHRVGGRLSPAPDAAPGLFIPGHVLDEVIRRARGIGGERRWLTLSFDDGYRDAVRYVTLRAAQHPEIDWRVFACPDKARRQSGFRWDAGLNPLASLPCDTVELIGENERPELLRAGSDPTTAVASLEELRSLWERDASTVGNHTNSHLPLAGLPPELATLELEASVACFEREVGPSRSFAFPFGTPGVYWGPEHASHLSSLGLEEIWSVQSRTFGAKERSCGAVLPRFPVDGRDSAHTILSLVVARASLERFRTRNLGSKQAVAARLVRRGCGYELGQSLVPLGGVALDATEAVPIVFVHGAAGHVETFRHVAEGVGRSRPVFGLRALGVIEGEAAAADLDEVLDAAIDAVKQLGRPVELVGYSLGGFIALQMARILEPAGLLSAVSMIDTYAPALEVLPLPLRLRNAAGFARRHGIRSLGAWGRRLGERQLRGLLRRRPAVAAWQHELGFGDLDVLGLIDLEEHYRRLTSDLAQLAPFDGPVRLFRSLELAPNLPADGGIGHLITDSEEKLVRGDHFSMMAQPRVQRLVTLLE